MPKMQRTSINLDGLKHANPIPAACRVGSLLMSGLISGVDPATGRTGETLAAQAEFMFAQMRRILDAAGAAPEDVVKVTVWIGDRSQRGAINPAWLAMFPDEASRPARQTMKTELDEGKLVQCDFIAVIRPKADGDQVSGARREA
jgi:2-iminobutanoate/2-iminopropanoate deaminase